MLQLAVPMKSLFSIPGQRPAAGADASDSKMNDPRAI
jgi:hypothetical protein